MIRFLVARIGWLIFTLWLVFTASFFLMKSVPGGPFDNEKGLPQETRELLERQFHLHLPLSEQYIRTLVEYLRLDAGPSYRLHDYRVSQVIAEGFPRSLLLGGFALLFALVFGVGAGALAAARRGSVVDTFVSLSANIGLALPNFLVAGLLVVVFCFVWPILPAAGWGGLRELVLPSICLGAPFAASIARLTRTGLLEVLAEDYVRTARAKGVHESAVVLKHSLRLALLPVVSFLGPATAGILTGSLVIERIFAIPGMGSHFVQAALSRDYTLSLGVVLLYTALVSGMNLLVDLLYRVLDPRVELW